MNVHDELRAARSVIANLASYSEPDYRTPRVHPPSGALELPHVRVEALTANWCMNGCTVEVGKVYTVSHGDAERLIAFGKAKKV